jgi:hypothetical protein
VRGHTWRAYPLEAEALHLEEVRGLRLHEVAQLPPLELAPVDGEDPIADGEHA